MRVPSAPVHRRGTRAHEDGVAVGVQRARTGEGGAGGTVTRSRKNVVVAASCSSPLLMSAPPVTASDPLQVNRAAVGGPRCPSASASTPRSWVCRR